MTIGCEAVIAGLALIFEFA